MTERTLARYCQKELGMSLHEWRQRLKVMKAMSMLNAGQTVENIALELGYANASALSRVFTQKLGVSPREWLAARRLPR